MPPVPVESAVPTPAAPEPQRLDVGEVRTLPEIEESLQVERRSVDQGGLRITKQVRSRVEVVDEPLTHQRVEIERRPIGQVLPEGPEPVARQEGLTWVVPVIEEVVVTTRQRVLVEEVRITTVQGTHHDPRHVTLRREEISIERLAPELPAARKTP